MGMHTMDVVFKHCGFVDCGEVSATSLVHEPENCRSSINAHVPSSEDI
jgi:hypothetical protein